MMNEDEIRALLDRYEQAISSGDEKAISQCWEVPAFVISEQGAVAISSKAEVERFYAKAGQYYRAQGLVTTLARIERVEMLSEGLATADVAWTVSDRSGNEKFTERYHYILHQDSQGQARIQVIATKT
jgi:ketosteroid isomerase-like protein